VEKSSNRRRSALLGQAFTWLCGGALAFNLLLVVGILALLIVNGMGYFWQKDLVLLAQKDGKKILGEVWEVEKTKVTTDEAAHDRFRLKIGNRDVSGLDFAWIDEKDVASRTFPKDAVLLERLEYGNFYGFLEELREGGRVLARGPQAVWRTLDSPRTKKERERLKSQTLVMRTAGGELKEMPVGNVVHAYRPNALGFFARLRLYLSRLWEFVSADPRESNTEGGIFPAIFGTVMMVFLMSVAVVPLGVLAALYLREYAKQGLLVRIVRIAVNNLAGVPSIVFGVFGLGFFVYQVGGSIDRLFFSEALPTPTFGTGGILWAALTLALLTVPVVIVAAEEGLAAVPRIVREGSLALGATQFETLWRVVLPAAAPGILTGMILAMGRAAGEVAPLMIVGMVKLAPSLPLDHHFPFVHLERKFMHLGFHIYDVGFQSPNVEATKPLVFATALLLILVVTLTNLAAIALRNHLRRKYAGSAI
jgi:phosphate transport system permease protein